MGDFCPLQRAIIIEKFGTLRQVKQYTKSFEEKFWSGGSLDRLYDSIGNRPRDPMSAMFVAAMKECLVNLEDYVPKSIGEINPMDFDKVYECPDLPCPTTMPECRKVRDSIKNEAFLFFRNSI